MDVGEWLRSLGLSQYEALFRQNDIDAEVLSELTDGDLEKFGVSFGHRKRLLKAIASLAAADPVAKPAGPAPSQTALDAGERRQLTVMFCDLVGSTALAARLDPEDMSDIIRAFQGAVSAAAARFEGFVAKFMGDGALVYFGYPQAHEDDAERAARAGVALVEAVRALQDDRGVALEVRSGIATGLVVVGELMGEGEARERGVVGETPNLAARLQALAEPGSIVVAEATRRLLGGTFDLNPLGPQFLKGFDVPVPVWTVLREAEHISRFEASRSEAMTPFVGREQEVALLLERWRDAAAGEGQAVLLSGEAGIGKSRILAALREKIAGAGHVTMRYHCSPHYANDAFYPISGQIWRAAGFTAGEPAGARLNKLEAMIAPAGLNAKELAPFIASLLSIPGGDRYPAPEMSPSEIKERTIAALMALLVGLTRKTPVLMLLEDAHWIDPSSLEVFGRIVDLLPGLRALLVVTARPEFTTPWAGRGHFSAHALNRFGRRQVIAMIDRIVGGKALPVEVLTQIVAKTDGVPLFVEELTKTVLESGLLRKANGAYVLAAPLTPLAIPSTLQDSLMARLDRLAPVKETAQIGAAIGREFSYRLLEAVSPIQGPALRDALGQLMVAELIHGRGAPPEAIYIFKHALVQDTAYASLLRSRRQRIHADIAHALEERFADQVDTAPALIAHHFTEAGLAEPAARYWLAAAELALSRSAPTEAGRYIDGGLSLLPRLTDGSERQVLELSLQLARANMLIQVNGFAEPETVAALTMAKNILDAGVGTDLQRFSVLYGLCFATFIAARMEPALAFAREIVGVADRQDDTIYKLVGHRLVGMIQVFMGQSRVGLENLQLCEPYYDPVRQKRLSYRFGTDPGLAVLCYKTRALQFLGLHDQATRVTEKVLAELPSHGHAFTVAMCNGSVMVWSELVFGDLVACEGHSLELIRYCTEKKVELWRSLGILYHACAHAKREPTKENIAALRAAIDIRHSSTANSICISYLAETLLTAGDVTGAEATLQEAFAFVEQSGERFWLADLHRVEGQIALKRSGPDPARAEACFLQAIEIARSQEARMLELRGATDLARLWRDTGSPDDPRALLEPILATIEGGESTRDVRNARALLREVT